MENERENFNEFDSKEQNQGEMSVKGMKADEVNAGSEDDVRNEG